GSPRLCHEFRDGLQQLREVERLFKQCVCAQSHCPFTPFDAASDDKDDGQHRVCRTYLIHGPPFVLSHCVEIQQGQVRWPRPELRSGFDCCVCRHHLITIRFENVGQRPSHGDIVLG